MRNSVNRKKESDVSALATASRFRTAADIDHDTFLWSEVSAPGYIKKNRKRDYNYLFPIDMCVVWKPSKNGQEAWSGFFV